MATRYLEAMQCLNGIRPEGLSEALRIADGRAGLGPSQGCDSRLMEIVSSVPDGQFRWFRLVLRRMSEKYDRRKNALPPYGELNLPHA
jgi:hypothetical protein